MATDNPRGYRTARALQKIEEALVFQKALETEREDAVNNLREILDTFNACLTGAQAR